MGPLAALELGQVFVAATSPSLVACSCGARPDAFAVRKAGIPHSTSRTWVVCRSSSSSSSLSTEDEKRLAAAKDLEEWLKQQEFPEQSVRLGMFGDMGLGCSATRNLQMGDLALSIPENYTVTSVDVANHPVISSAAEGRGDLVGLTLWLMYERSKLEDSPWYPYLRVLPPTTSSPLLWTSAEQEELLKGSPTLGEVKQQLAALEEQFDDLKKVIEKESKLFPMEILTFDAFKTAFSVILSRAVYLPSAELCALVPFADSINHESSRSWLDYDIENQKVILKVDKSYKEGEQVFASYGQDPPNSDLLIRYGFIDENNENDSVEIEVGLVAGDPLQSLKREILQQLGFNVPQRFPLYLNRFPTQLLTYVRLARIQDPALFAKINFDKDIIVDQTNEYEVLMLLMAECRTKLFSYSNGTVEEEMQTLRRKKLSYKEKVTAQLRSKEKKILIDTMDALRNRLAPIRGIPTKSGGLKDPNSDIREMFDMVEQVASAPRKFFSNILKK